MTTHDSNSGPEGEAPESRGKAEVGPPPRLLRVPELAALLGVHEKTIYDWVARRRLPCLRLGNRLRFDPNDIARWLASRKEE